MEHSGHLEGMLDRDQRTAKLRFFDHSDSHPAAARTYSFQERTASEASIPAGRHCCHPARTKGFASASRSSRRNGHLLNTVQSLKNVLAVVFIIAVTLPIVNSKPIGAMDMPPEKWLNPCDANEKIIGNEDLIPSDIPISEFKKVAQQAETAQKQANKTLDAFVSKVLRDETITSTLNDQKIDWLPNLPKDMDNLEVDVVLSNTYNYLQRAAVGLDLVVQQADGQSDSKDGSETMLVDDFKEAENQLRRVLCELWHIIVESNRALPKDVHRDIVSDSDKQKESQGDIKTRNYIILRKYADTLDYVIQVFSQLGR